MANVTAAEGGQSILACDTVYGPGAGHLHERIAPNPYPYGECTWLCWQYYWDTQQLRLPSMGNATDWTTAAHREGWAVDMEPVVGKVMCWSSAKYPEFGHVGIVTGTDPLQVTEMNFTYYADRDPSLAGKIDCREVPNLDGVSGLLTPHGAQLGAGQDAGGSILDALGAPMRGIAAGIEQAGLYVQAELMTAQHKAMSIAQVGGGLVIVAGGGALAGFTLAGRGDPGAGARIAAGRLRRAQVEPEAAPETAWTDAERAWLAMAARQPAAPPARAGRGSRPALPRAAKAPSPAAQLRTEIRAARAARRAAGPGGKGWTEATVRLRLAEGKLAALNR